MAAPVTGPALRAAERAWQDTVGHALQDRPFQSAGCRRVLAAQWARVLAPLAALPAGAVVLEVGAGAGHFLRQAPIRFPSFTWVGLDLSRVGLEQAGPPVVQGDAEALPLHAGAVDAVVVNGALHHCPDVPQALREALGVLRPGGLLVLFEPVSSRFTRLVHRLVDPCLVRWVPYLSPADRHTLSTFCLSAHLPQLTASADLLTLAYSDAFAYPLTGCYAAFSTPAWLLRAVLRAETWITGRQWGQALCDRLAWRVLVVARRRA